MPARASNLLPSANLGGHRAKPAVESTRRHLGGACAANDRLLPIGRPAIVGNDNCCRQDWFRAGVILAKAGWLGLK
jgi:hypothetical protein